MKHLIVPISILVFVVALIITNQLILENLTSTLINDLSIVENDIKHDDFEDSEKTMQEFSDKYQKYNFYFSIVVRHTELDEIRLLVKKLEAYNKLEDKKMFLAESNALSDMLKHIYELDKINLENIL